MRGLFQRKSTDTPHTTRRRLDAASQKTRASAADLDARYSFRRNRTLTGSLSSGVSSVSERSAELRSPRVHGHELRRLRRRLALILIVAAAAAAGLGALIYQSVATVRVESRVATTRPLESARYEALINRYLSSRPLERFRFSLNTAALAQYMIDNGAPEVRSIDPVVTYSGFGASTVRLAMRAPAVVWNTGGSTTYVDDTGMAFERNYYAQPTVNVVDKSGVQTKHNQVLASNRFLGFMGKVIGQMKRNGLQVGQLSLPSGTSRQVEVTLLGESYPIRFSTDRPAGEQAEDAARAVRYLRAAGVAPRYIDVRVSGKAFYQ